MPEQNGRLTREQAQLIRTYLLGQFPWLRSDDQEMPSGSDVIEQLASIAETLSEVKQMNNYRVAYTVHSDIDEEPVGSDSVDVIAETAKEARKLAVAKAHDTDPRCDERIHPQVRVTDCKRRSAK